MTQPTPAPAAPTPTPTPAGPAPTPTPPATPTPWSPDSLPPEGKAWLDSQVAEADKKARTGSKTNAANEVTAKIAKALGLTPSQDGPPTVDSLAGQFTELKTRLEEAAARAEEAETVAQISRTAARLGADADALLDSRRVVDQLNAIEAASPAAYDAAVEKVIAAAIAANPALKSGTPPSPPPASGVDFPGGTTAGQPITEAQLAQMTPQQLAAAYNEGKLKHLL